MTQDLEAPADRRGQKAQMDERLEGLGWGVLLVVIGTIWLLPERIVPPGTWLIAAGTIILGVNAIRYLKGIETRSFGMLVGVVALFAGLRALLDVDLPLFPVALIVIGLWILVKRLTERSAPQERARQGRTAAGLRDRLPDLPSSPSALSQSLHRS
jgi:hypothetical protein